MEAEVVVRFTVDKTGLVRSPQVVNVNARTPLITAETAKAAKDGNPDAVEASKNYYDAIEALKEEAIHVVRNMPRWEPGRQNGKRIDTTYTLPINFKLQWCRKQGEDSLDLIPFEKVAGQNKFDLFAPHFLYNVSSMNSWEFPKGCFLHNNSW